MFFCTIIMSMFGRNNRIFLKVVNVDSFVFFIAVNPYFSNGAFAGVWLEMI